MVYKIVFNLHIIISFLTIIAGLATVIRAIRGWSASKNYDRVDLMFSLAFTIGLYLQLILGFIIYVILRSQINNPAFEVTNSSNDASLRFWAIEHIALMIFALFLTQLGRIYIKHSTNSLNRYRSSLFYYGTSLVLILFSLSVAVIFK
jgi:uncharacterized protein with PQ loop repeat